MSVLIKGMQMPELYETYKINIAKTREGKIVLGMCKIDETSYRLIGEVIELPEHHGRLIDEDRLMRVYEDRFEKVADRYGVDSSEAGIISGAMKLLMIEPGVVEAK